MAYPAYAKAVHWSVSHNAGRQQQPRKLFTVSVSLNYVKVLLSWAHAVTSTPCYFSFSKNCTLFFPSSWIWCLSDRSSYNSGARCTIFYTQFKITVLFFPNYNQQDATFLDLFISTDALHVSGGSSVHHQEHVTVHTASGIVNQYCCCCFSISHAIAAGRSTGWK